MFKYIRIAVLAYILLFVAVSTYLTQARSREWDRPLWVNVYAAPAPEASLAQAARAVTSEELAPLEEFFSSQAHAYGLRLDRPFRFYAAGVVDEPLPPIPTTRSRLDALVWSLTMRWRATSLGWSSDAPTPDIVLFIVRHEQPGEVAIERSGALRKGLIAVAHVGAARAARTESGVIIAHELLHTLGATDKYDLATNLPFYPDGYADPDRSPLHPQERAELMGGRIPETSQSAAIPRGLEQVMIGPVTAFEIGWTATTSAAARQPD